MTMNQRGQIFDCKVEPCQYISQNFNKTLNHTWDKHGLRLGFFIDMRFLTALGDIQIFKVFGGM